MALLDPVSLLIFFGALAAAYGLGRLVRTLRLRGQRSRRPSPESMTRAERRRAARGRR